MLQQNRETRTEGRVQKRTNINYGTNRGGGQNIGEGVPAMKGLQKMG